jgi:hypothetical protein
MAGPGEILMARLGLPRRNHREGGHGLRVVIHVQQIFWAMEVYIAVVAVQRVEGYPARPPARHHWRPENLRADGTVNNGRTVVQIFRLARYWLFAFAAGSKAPIARLSLCEPTQSDNGPGGPIWERSRTSSLLQDQTAPAGRDLAKSMRFVGNAAGYMEAPG